MGIDWSIENLKNSLFWLTSWMLKLKAEAEFNEVHFQHCMHGGTRDEDYAVGVFESRPLGFARSL